MEPYTYSVIADLLAKFHTASDWIQALWLVTLAAMVAVVSWSVAGVLKALIRALTPRRANAPLLDKQPSGEADAQWLAYRNGELWLMRLPAPPVSSRDAADELEIQNRNSWE